MEALILTFALLASPFARGEYRAYQLTITNESTGAQRTVLSNFDAIQYRDLYPVLKEETIQMEDTWMCYGDTSKSPFAPIRRDLLQTC